MTRWVLAVAATLAATPALAAPADCAIGGCTVKMTAMELQAAAERLLGEGRYAEAKPLAAVLTAGPEYSLRSRLLSGLIASETGDRVEAARLYRSVLGDDPSQPRARLELGKAMLAPHQPGSADRQFAMAMQDRDLAAGGRADDPHRARSAASCPRGSTSAWASARAARCSTRPCRCSPPRRDWRGTARLTLGIRELRVIGLSPQLGVSVSRIASSIGFLRTSRARVEPALARYF